MGFGNITTGRMHGKIGNLQYQQWKSKTVVRTLNPKGKKNRQASQVNKIIFENIKIGIDAATTLSYVIFPAFDTSKTNLYQQIVKANKPFFKMAESTMGGMLLPGFPQIPIGRTWYNFSNIMQWGGREVHSLKVTFQGELPDYYKNLTPLILSAYSKGVSEGAFIGEWATDEKGNTFINTEGPVEDKGEFFAVAFCEVLDSEAHLKTLPIYPPYFEEQQGDVWTVPESVAATLGQMTLSNLLYKDVQVKIALQTENIPGYVTFDSIEFPGENTAFADNPIPSKIIKLSESTFTQTVNDIYANTAGVGSCYLYDSTKAKRVSTAFTTVLNYTKYTANELQTNCYCQLTYEYMATDDMTFSYINMYPKKPTGTVSNIYGKPRISQGYPLWYPDYVDALLYLEDPDISATGQVTGTVATCGSCILTTKDGNVDISERFMLNCINITS